MKAGGRTPDAASERLLEDLKREAARAGAIERAGTRPAGAPFPAVSPVRDYSGVPLLKEPTWTCEVPMYFFVGGAAGASAVLAAAARWTGADRRLVRDARWIAAAGAALSPPLLVSDLGRPERFLNMLRVFKPQSAMSVGAWTLVAFSTASAAAAFAELLGRRTRGRVPVRVLSDASGALAAATGLVMSTYTGVLVGATSIPVWSEHVTALPIHFAASALASAVGLLELAGNDERALQTLGLGAAAAETLLAILSESPRNRATLPLRAGASGALVRSGELLSGPVALLLRLLAGGNLRRRRYAAICAIAGSLLTRFGWVAAGHASAKDPRSGL